MTNKQALRERYAEKPAPKCHICGSVMSIKRAGGGSVVYGCTGRIDEEGEGYKFEAGRGFADDHYARSRVTDYSPSGDPEVLALLDELEVISKSEWKLAGDLTEAQMNNTVLEKKLEAAEKRIAELERKEHHIERQSVIDALATAGESWSDIEEYMQQWDAEHAASRINGEW